MKKKYELLLKRMKIRLSNLRSKRHPYSSQTDLEIEIINVKLSINHYEKLQNKQSSQNYIYGQNLFSTRK